MQEVLDIASQTAVTTASPKLKLPQTQLAVVTRGVGAWTHAWPKTQGLKVPRFDQKRGGCYAHATNHKTLLTVPGGGDRSEVGVQEDREPVVEFEGGSASGDSRDEHQPRHIFLAAATSGEVHAIALTRRCSSIRSCPAEGRCGRLRGDRAPTRELDRAHGG
ncbi:hypothetical protein MTO96_047838 [Rhipicephalus appendiculatus]